MGYIHLWFLQMIANIVIEWARLYKLLPFLYQMDLNPT